MKKPKTLLDTGMIIDDKVEFGYGPNKKEWNEKKVNDMKTKQKKLHGVAFMISVLSKKQREDADRLSSLEERVSELEYPLLKVPKWKTAIFSVPIQPVVNKECSCKQSCQPKEDITDVAYYILPHGMEHVYGVNRNGMQIVGMEINIKDLLSQQRTQTIEEIKKGLGVMIQKEQKKLWECHVDETDRQARAFNNALDLAVKRVGDIIDFIKKY